MTVKTFIANPNGVSIEQDAILYGEYTPLGRLQYVQLATSPNLAPYISTDGASRPGEVRWVINTTAPVQGPSWVNFSIQNYDPGPFVNNIVYPQDFGAVGDGVTDDTAAIQAAINACAADGGVVFLPTGSYLVSTTGTGVFTQPSNVHIVGSGPGATQIINNQQSGTTGGVDIFTANNVSNVSIRSLSIVGNALSTDLASQPHGEAIYYQSVDNFTINNVATNYMRQGGLVIGTIGGGGSCSNGRVTSFQSTMRRGAPLGLLSCENVNVDGVVFSGSEGIAIENGPILRCNVSNVVAVYDTADFPNAGFGYAVQVLANDGDITAVTVSNVKAYWPGLSGLQVLSSTSGNVVSLTVSNFDVDGTGANSNNLFQIDTSGGGTITDLRTSNLIARNAGIRGAYLNGYTGPFTGFTSDGAQQSGIQQNNGEVWYDDCHVLNSSQNSLGDAPAFYVEGNGIAHWRGGRLAGANDSQGFNAATTATIDAEGTDVASETHPYLVGSGTLRFSNCAGINPAGLVAVTVPASGTATAALPYDATFYITASTSTVGCAVTDTAGTSQTVATIPASGFAGVFVPAGSTLTPTYTAAPTWTVQGH